MAAKEGTTLESVASPRTTPRRGSRATATKNVPAWLRSVRAGRRAGGAAPRSRSHRGRLIDSPRMRHERARDRGRDHRQETDPQEHDEHGDEPPGEVPFQRCRHTRPSSRSGPPTTAWALIDGYLSCSTRVIRGRRRRSARSTPRRSRTAAPRAWISARATALSSCRSSLVSSAIPCEFGFATSTPALAHRWRQRWGPPPSAMNSAVRHDGLVEGGPHPVVPRAAAATRISGSLQRRSAMARGPT